MIHKRSRKLVTLYWLVKDKGSFCYFRSATEPMSTHDVNEVSLIKVYFLGAPTHKNFQICHIVNC